MDILNNNYPVFIVNNNEEFRNIQQKLFDIYIIWITGEEEVFSEPSSEFPIHIFINMNEKRFFYRTKGRLYHNSVKATILDNYEVDDENSVTDRTHTLYEFDRVFKLKPNYKPKGKRILESLDNKKYRFKTREEFEQEYGIGWGNKVYWNSDGFMDYLFGTDLEISVPDEDYWEIDIPNKNFNYGDDNNDFVYWEINPKMIKEKIYKPNYIPKKKRVLENLLLEDKIKYLPFRIWCDTLEDAIDCEEFLHKNRYYYPMEPKKFLLRDGNWDFTCFTFTNLNRNNRTFDGYDYKLTELGKEELVFPKDKGKIKNVLKFGKTSPTYKPKNKKLNEKNNSFSNANEITILIRNVDELILLDNSIKPLGYVIREGFFNLMKQEGSPINIFIDLNSGSITQTTLDDFRRRNFNISSVFDGVWNRELTIEDLPYIIRILKAGRIIEERPSYKPRKINKLDEVVNYDLLKYMPNYPPIINPEEQRKLFKVGDKVIIRPDAYDYFRDIDTDFMNIDLGQEVIIKDVNTLNDVYGYDNHKRIINTSVVNGDDLLITVKSPRHNNTYYWYYRCLYIPIKRPDYSPRKKVLENLNEEYRGELTDNVNHSYYFSKYNSFFVVFDSDIKEEDYTRISTLLTKIFNVETPDFRFLYKNDKQFYIVIRINRTSEEMKSGWNVISALKNSNERNNDIYPKPFTINEVNTESKVNHILKNGGIIPSYSPRKINKFDES